MRRAMVFRLVGAALVIAAGAYSAFWWVAAGKAKDAAAKWQEAARAQKIDASWQSLRVAGYPFAFRLEFADAAITDGANNPPAELHAPALSATIHPWDLHTARFDAPNGVAVTLGPAASPIARVDAEIAGGAATRGADGTTTVWLSLYRAKADAGVTLGARAVHAWATLPPGETTQLGGGLALAIEARELALPAAPPGFKPAIDDLAFGLTMTGTFPAGPPRQAATAWRDSGGTVALDHLYLRWGDMEINGSGTLALDSDLQPAGGFSGGVAGFDQLLTALVEAGRVKASDARVARLALALLAKAGPDGRPEISTSLAIQNGEMFLGPAKLGRAPRIDW